MYQNPISKQIRVAGGAIVVALMLSASAAGAQDVEKCRREILKRTQKLASTAMKALNKCETGRFKGDILTACSVDPTAQGKIGDAAAKLAEKVADKCDLVTLADIGFAGKVSRCTGGNANGDRCVDTEDCRFPPATTGPEDGTCGPVDECPGFLNGADGCEFPLAGISAGGASNDVIECLQCITNAKVASVVDAYYGVLEAPSDDNDVNKCQLELGKRAAKYFDKVEKTLKKCEDGNIKDATAIDCVSDPDGKIGEALAKLDEKILDKCDTAEKINLAIKPGELYARAGRYGSCGTAAPGTAQGLADVLECITENSAACDIAMNIGDAACGPQLCGNGQIDTGETCDDGNTLTDSGVGPADVCPSDCAVAACTDAGDDTVSIAFATPGGISLYGLTVVVTYTDAKVRIPGTGGDPAVQAALNSLSFGMTPNDTDYALRNVLSDPFLFGVPPGAAFDVTFDTCQGGGALAAGDVQCIVVDAVDTSFATVDGVTCSVTL
jgi:cysteine-rich repeat protein